MRATLQASPVERIKCHNKYVCYNFEETKILIVYWCIMKAKLVLKFVAKPKIWEILI